MSWRSGWSSGLRKPRRPPASPGVPLAMSRTSRIPSAASGLTQGFWTVRVLLRRVEEAASPSRVVVVVRPALHATLPPDAHHLTATTLITLAHSSNNH
ncbi:hypothetical protein E2C01_022215 [Portunus trituberculatus]|uniref:Uncharacterized protein n=1 Tax=Portunus trituberculatus TaxID=210409 RepID=A0A5B7E6F3_PORTR|nr:hypothetical protein [Portunus trituberculatus]